MTTGTIEVTEMGTRLAFSYDDLLRYHGPANPGGVAHAFKVLERALPLLSPDDPPGRREIEVATSFAGPGGRDGFELVTRAVSDQRYVVDPGMERPERGETLMRYVFRLGYRSRSVTLVIREGYVTDEFIALARRSDLTADEAHHLAILKQEMADRLLAKPAAEVYDVASGPVGIGVKHQPDVGSSLGGAAP